MELGVRVAQLIQNAAAGEGGHINIRDKSNLAGQGGRGVLGAVDTLELVLLDVGLGLGHLDLSADHKALPLRLAGLVVDDGAVVGADGLSRKKVKGRLVRRRAKKKGSGLVSNEGSIRISVFFLCLPGLGVDQ